MDIEGAKALKERIGASADDATSVSQDVPADAPPLYRWFGVRQDGTRTVSPDADDEAPAPNASFLRRLGLGSG